MPVGEGNNVLRILHHRRTSGSLVDYGIDNLGARYESLVDRRAAEKALQWLRDQYPIDEARAAEEWAEKEANRIAYELWLADPENSDSKYNDPARVFKEQQDKEKKRRQEEEDDEDEMRIGILRAGKSQFEKNFERQRKARLEAAARAAEEKEQREREMQEKLATGEWVKTPTGTQLMKPHQTTYVDIFGREQVSRRKEELEKYQKKAQTPFKSEEEMLQSTTLTQRLVPMTIFVALLVAACTAFAHLYVPPAPEYRFWPALSPSTATVLAIVAANAFVCALWRVGPLWPFLTAYFMHVPGYPRAVQSILNVFSHVQYEHLLSNMMFLALAGYACHELVGRGTFVGTYLSAGALGSLASLYWNNVGRGSPTVHSVGASAAIWGISALYCLLTDAETIKVPFTQGTEVAFWPKTLFAAFAVLEIRAAWRARKGGSTMDHASHVGGILAGVSVAGYMRAQGFHSKREGAGAGEGLNAKVVDPAAMVKEEVSEVKEGLKKVVKKE